jgi:lipoprotein-anchoring transpeptidase ErfK/SrfK
MRGNALPYLYALTGEARPHLYFRLPTLSQMQAVEGASVVSRVANYRARIENGPIAKLLGPASPPPDYLAKGESLQKPYGVEGRLHRSVHSGQANADSGFAIKLAFEWSGRLFGLTTEHDLLPLDRTRVVVPSAFRGVELSGDASLPAAFVMNRYAGRHRPSESGELQQDGWFDHRSGVVLTGKARAGGLVETAEGDWVANAALRRIERRESFPSFATGDRKWLDISIRDQSLVAYSGRRPVYVTLVSTGRGGMGDPEKVDATVRGTFMIHYKAVSSTMDGDEDRADSYTLKDVPFVQYFHKGYALHGTYWHDEFGKLRSHGCVNLSPADAAWLFEWTDPPVPENWHAVLNKERGTVVYVHL